MAYTPTQITEKALLFGKNNSLVGVLTEPSDSAKNYAVLFLNSGILHRIGPNRLYVNIARLLANEGLYAFRFDFSGIGDSTLRIDDIPFDKSTILEVQEAMDLLQSQLNIDKFILAGICSGANHAFKTACRDNRVVGATLIDFDYFLSLRYYFLSRLWLNVRSWRKIVSGKSGLWRFLIPEFLSSNTQKGQLTPVRQILPENQISDGITQLLNRQVKLLFIYSDRSPAYYNYHSRVKKYLRKDNSAGNVRIELIKKSDHLFTQIEHQDMLINLIHTWTSELTL